MSPPNTPQKIYSPELLTSLGDALAAQLKVKPAVVDSQPLTARQVVVASMPKVLALMAKGYSIRAIHTTFVDAGVVVTLNTFKTYVAALRPKPLTSKVTPASTPTQLSVVDQELIAAKPANTSVTPPHASFGKPSAADYLKSKSKVGEAS